MAALKGTHRHHHVEPTPVETVDRVVMEQYFRPSRRDLARGRGGWARD
jgi:hypothetical protein